MTDLMDLAEFDNDMASPICTNQVNVYGKIQRLAASLWVLADQENLSMYMNFPVYQNVSVYLFEL